MNPTQREVEAYANTSDIGAIISRLSEGIGPLTTESPAEEDLRIYTSGGVSVVLQTSEDGFLSIWIRGATVWPSSLALGRYLAAELDCVVRCDPEGEIPQTSPYSNVFLQIARGCESLVSWG